MDGLRNRKVTVETNGRMLEFMGDQAQVHPGVTVEDRSFRLVKSARGRPAAIGCRAAGHHWARYCCGAERASDCLIGGHSLIQGAHLQGAMIGQHATVRPLPPT